MWSSTTCLLLNFSVCFPHWWETTVSLETNVSFSCRQAVWKAQNVETTSSKWNLRLANCHNPSRNHSLVFVPSLWHQPYIFDTESQASGKLNPQPVVCKKHHKSMLTMCLSVITWPAVYDSQGQWLRQPHWYEWGGKNLTISPTSPIHQKYPTQLEVIITLHVIIY